jgi:hypothetical protein
MLATPPVLIARTRSLDEPEGLLLLAVALQRFLQLLGELVGRGIQ